jgi:hypothetical protein
MTMTFHISEALLIERALFVAAMILIFGLISIGGLYLLRRRIMPARNTAPSLQEALAGLDQAGPATTQVEAMARIVEAIARILEPEHKEQQSQTQTRQEVAPSTRV